MLIECGVLPKVMACLRCSDTELRCLAAGIVASLCCPPSSQRGLRGGTGTSSAATSMGNGDGLAFAADLGDNPRGSRRRQHLDESTWGWIAGQVMVCRWLWAGRCVCVCVPMFNIRGHAGEARCSARAHSARASNRPTTFVRRFDHVGTRRCQCTAECSGRSCSAKLTARQ